MFGATLSGHGPLQSHLAVLVARAKDRRDILASVGHRMAFTHVPLGLRQNIGGWPVPRRGGAPLLDTGRMANAIAYRATESNVTVGTNAPYSRALQWGAVIRPKSGRYLNVPLSPPLSRTAARAFPVGKQNIRAKYPGSFGLAKGPEGPGIYLRRGKGRIERIAAWRKSVAIRRYLWLRWYKQWQSDVRDAFHRYMQTGALVAGKRASSGGRSK